MDMRIGSRVFQVRIESEGDQDWWWRAACFKGDIEFEIQYSEFKDNFLTREEALNHWKKFAEANGIRKYVLKREGVVDHNRND